MDKTIASPAPSTARWWASTGRRSLPFQAGIRKRYTDEQILVELTACAKRRWLLADDAGVRGGSGDQLDPQTAIEHFGSWNEAKRKAGLVPRPFATPLFCSSC